MKELLKTFFLAAAIIILTLILAAAAAEKLAPSTVTEDKTISSDSGGRAVYTLSGDGSFSVLCEKTGEVTTLSFEEYLIGAVMAQMPYTYPEEALKAQAAAAATYAVRRTEEQLSNPSPELKGAFISDNSEKYQSFFTEEQARLFYGGKYDEAYEKISSAVHEAADTIIIYNGEPIVAAFHEVSTGMTESAENVWGTYLPYLVPVDSEYDKAAPDFLYTREYTLTEFSARLYAAYPESFSSETLLRGDITEKTSSGTVLTVSFGDISLSGQDMSRIFSLPSSCFDISYSDELAVISCYGKGHGAGMSQYGAKALAETGLAYDRILLHYYKGAELAELTNR